MQSYHATHLCFFFSPQTRASTVAGKRKKQPYGLRRIAFGGGENRICPVAKPRGSVATPLQNTTVAKRYVISLSCSRSIEKGLPLQAFVWRREQDLNLRRLLTSHAFQACALNRSTISPSVFLEVKKELSHHFSYLPK